MSVLLTNGNVFRRTDGRWGGVVWYLDDSDVRRRKSFSGNTKVDVQKKITKYITDFDKIMQNTDESKLKLRDSMQNWLETFKYAAVEHTTYDRLISITRTQIYPEIGKRIVGKITAADIRHLLNRKMDEGYAYSTVKKVHDLLSEYFRYLAQEEILKRDPMISVPMIKKKSFYTAQGKELLPINQTVTVFTSEEIEIFKKEAFLEWGDPPIRKHQQAAAYILMLNTGIRTGEALGIRNCDIDLEKKVLHIRQGVKEVSKRIGRQLIKGRTFEVGSLKTASSKRDIPLNSLAIEMIKDLRKEFRFGPNSPLICDEYGGYTAPVNFRKRFYRILDQAGIKRKGLHSLRHTFATNLVNGIKQPDGSIKSLSPRQVADLLGHTTSELTEIYYVKKDNERLIGITDDFEL